MGLVTETIVVREEVHSLEDVVISGREARRVWWIRHSFVAQPDELSQTQTCCATFGGASSWKKDDPFLSTNVGYISWSI